MSLGMGGAEEHARGRREAAGGAFARSEPLAPCGSHALDRLTGLATRLLSAPMAVASLVDRERAVHAGCTGLPEPAASSRSTPLSHSLCRLVAGGEPLIVEDAHRDARVAGNPAVGALGLAACACFPIASADGAVLGAFSVLDRVPRRWTPLELRSIEDLAAAAADEVLLLQVVRDHAEIVDLLQTTLRAREQQMSNAAHDLRSPLHGALLVLQILETQGSTAETNGVLGRALRSMGDIIGKRLGAEARREQGIVAPQGIDPGALLSRARSAFAVRAAAQEVELSGEVPGGLPEVWADPARLDQVLSNLVASAFRHAGKRSRIVLAARDDGDFVRFEVRAAGPRPAELDGDAPASLGWSAARALVLAHGGEAGVEPGPCFWFTLPQALT